MKKTLFVLSGIAVAVVLLTAAAVRSHGQEEEGSDPGPLFRVMYNGQWGFMDKEGDIVIKPQFEEASDFSPEGVAVVKVGSNYGFIDKTGKLLKKPILDGVWGVAVRPSGLRMSNRWAYIDAGGRTVIDVQFSQAPGYSDGMIPVEVSGKWGYANTEGEIVVAARYYRTWPFRDGLGEVWVSPNPNTTLGYIDRAGKWAWKPTK